MRSILTIALSLFFASASLIAQEEDQNAELLSQRPSLEVQKQLINFQKDSRSAYSLYVVAPADDVSKAWKGFLESKYQLEPKKMKNGYEAVQVSLADISADKLDFYSLIKEDENGARLDVLINKNGTYVSPSNNPTESAAIEGMMQTFARDFYVAHYDKVLGDQRKSAEKITKEHEKSVKEGEKLVKQEESLNAAITKAEQDIVDADKKIAELEAKKESLKGEIGEARGSIDMTKKEQATNAKAQAEKKAAVDAIAKRIEKLKANADSFRTDK